MPVEFTNLGINLFQAEASQQIQNLFLAAERANTQVAAEKSQDQGKAQATDQVQDTAKTETQEIRGEGRGAHSHTLGEKEEEKKPPEPPKPPPPDPIGRGKIIDLQG